MPRQYATLDAEGFVPQSQLRGQSYRSLVLDLAPVGYWRLGETTGVTAADETGNYDATYVNAPTLGVPGLLANDPDTAVDFSGTGQYVTTPILPALASDWSMAVAFRADVLSTFLFNGIGDVAPWSSVTSAGAIQLRWKDSGGTLRQLITGSGLVVVGNEYRAVFRHDGTTATIVFNGEVIASTSAWDSKVVPSQAWNIGANQNGLTAWNGVIDEPAIFNRALTATEVAALYEAGT